MESYGKIITVAALVFASQLAISAPVVTDGGKLTIGYTAEKAKSQTAQNITSGNSAIPGYKLVPIEECAKAPVIDVMNDSIYYPCGFKVVKIKKSDVAKKPAQPILNVSASTSPLETFNSKDRYNGSTIHDNGDGTSTINHGGNVTETISSADADKIIMQYGDVGLKVSRDTKPTKLADTKL